MSDLANTKEEPILPTEDDFDPTGRDPDARWAWVNFGTLTIIDAATKLRERPDIYPEAFGAMGGKAFAFYFWAVDDHLRHVPTQSEDGDDSGAEFLAHCIKNQFEKSACHVRHLAPQVVALSQYVRQNIGRYGYDADERRRIANAWMELENYVEQMTRGIDAQVVHAEPTLPRTSGRMTEDFHLIDLISQSPAVERVLRGKSVSEKLAWLSSRGRLLKIDKFNPSWPDTYSFESTIGMQCAFIFDADYFLFLGDNAFFTASDDYWKQRQPPTKLA